MSPECSSINDAPIDRVLVRMPRMDADDVRTAFPEAEI